MATASPPAESRFARAERAWFTSYQPRLGDLAFYRVLFACYVLVGIAPVGTWVAELPQTFFRPPIGHAGFFASFPSPPLLLGLNLLLVIAAALLLVGWRTGLMSALVGLALILINGFVYATGKINHDILIVLVPLVMSVSGWGGAWSLDARRIARRGLAPRSPPGWPMALLALFIGYAMFTAGLAKLQTGWLDPEQLCTYGHLASNYLTADRYTRAAEFALKINSVLFWKAADYSAVLLELAFLPAVLHPRLFRPMLAVACLFHVGVLVLFKISFPWNVVAYAAFLVWPRLTRTATNALALPRPLLITLFVSSTLAGVGLALGRPVVVALGMPLHQAIIAAGGLVGVGYLLSRLRRRKTINYPPAASAAPR